MYFYCAYCYYHIIIICIYIYIIICILYLLFVILLEYLRTFTFNICTFMRSINIFIFNFVEYFYRTETVRLYVTLKFQYLTYTIFDCLNCRSINHNTFIFISVTLNFSVNTNLCIYHHIIFIFRV